MGVAGWAAKDIHPSRPPFRHRGLIDDGYRTVLLKESEHEVHVVYHLG